MGSDKQYNTHCGEMQVFLVLSSRLFLSHLFFSLFPSHPHPYSPCPSDFFLFPMSIPTCECVCVCALPCLWEFLLRLPSFPATLPPLVSSPLNPFALFSCVTLVHTPLR